MNIRLITPAPPSSKAGNRATATRWADFLQRNAHKVTISVKYTGQPADLMIALHAWRSAEAIRLFKHLYPSKPVLLALTGTDIYKFQLSDPEVCYASMDQADVMVGLHALVKEGIPKRYWPKLNIVYQSAETVAEPPPPTDTLANSDRFDICVVGHLRDEKDSLRAALAARKLPAESSIRIIQAGKAHNAKWQRLAEQEQDINPRYQWWGEVSQDSVKALMGGANIMVISSAMEGGANVVSEACVAGLPIIASDIAGNIGLLGDHYPGYYPVQDTQALAELMLRAENDPAFVRQLRQHCVARAAWFTPEKECVGINHLVDRLTE